ncbi:AAA family ATPase [Desulfoscipio geothermicus]|uniref:AAA domain-containing protein n=1 Tax=Desulfoscipio geothermicus DSM 3669 TaxID=1121426 RepID=A0A1I6DII2_9FIRM|nr:AAA family ATPase [Desulfoscipio geothermicus]SFR05246.1 AAA domain-containing protein [Desulfoscipio geothermicus DSM 3669]
MKVISVYGVSKLSGNTTIAEELALVSQGKGYKTLLVDLDIHNGDVTERLKINNYPNISDWCEDIYNKSRKTPITNIEYTRAEWAQFIQEHSSGLHVLATNTDKRLPHYGNIYYEIRIIYNSLKEGDYDVMVVDMSNTPTSFNYFVMEDADVPILVVDTFRYNVKSLQHFLWDLEDVHFPVEKLQLLFNRKPSPVEESPEKVAGELNLPLLGILPEFAEDLAKTVQVKADLNKTLGQIFDKIMSGK